MDIQQNLMLPVSYKQSCLYGANVVGNKAYNIARLAIAGFDVPKGCVLPANAWEAIHNNSINAQYRDHTIEWICNYLNVDRYAVRSSAVGEDSSIGSWAGCFESVLSVESEHIWDAVLICGNSLYGRRAQEYCKLKPGIMFVEKMGVLIQEYLFADWNGVSFSANPVTRNHDQIVIEFQNSANGSVVEGRGIPQTVVIDKKNLTQQRNIEFPNDFVKKVFRITSEIEVFMGIPVDVEWLIAHDCLYIVQARPITTVI